MQEYTSFPSALSPNPAAVFESGAGVMFGNTKNGELEAKPEEIGNHGHWPMRYRAVYLLWGPGVPHRALPEFSMKEIAGRIASVLGVKL